MCKVLLGEFDINDLSGILEGSLQELIVVRRPRRRYRKASKNGVAQSRLGAAGKLIDDCLSNAAAAAFLIQVILRDREEVCLAVDIKL